MSLTIYHGLFIGNKSQNASEHGFVSFRKRWIGSGDSFVRRAHSRNLIVCLDAEQPRAPNNLPGMLFSGLLYCFLLTSTVNSFCCKCLIITILFVLLHRFLQRFLQKETELLQSGKANVSATTQANRQKKMQEISSLMKFFIKCANQRNV